MAHQVLRFHECALGSAAPGYPRHAMTDEAVVEMAHARDTTPARIIAGAVGVLCPCGKPLFTEVGKGAADEAEPTPKVRVPLGEKPPAPQG